MRFAFLLVAATAAVAAPVPKGAKKPTDYFPTAVGSTWEYVLEGMDTLDLTREVTESAEKGGVRTATFKWTGRGYTTASRYRIEAGVIERLGYGPNENFKRPFRMFTSDSKPGATWAAEGDEGHTNAVRGEEEEVVTPAGTFRAVPVTISDNRGQPNHVCWYAPGVGMVKWKTPVGKTIVLSKFTPGK